MRALVLCVLTLSACDFDKRYADCVDAGKCQTGSGGNNLTGDSTLDFGTVAVGDTIARQHSFSNTGSSATEPISFSVDGGAFSFVGSGCSGITLNSTASCQVSVSGSPQLGMNTGTLFIDGGAGSGLRVDLRMQGVVALTLTPSPLDFGNVTQGRTSTRSFTVNSSSVQTKPLAPELTGSSDFFLTDGGTCGADLAAITACSIEVGFTPSNTDPQTGTLTIAPGVSATIQGTGVPLGALQFDNGELDLGTMDAGQSVTARIVLSNTGGTSSGPITFTNPTPFFSVDAGICGSGLGPGATCLVAVTFSSPTAGEKRATLQAQSTDAGLALLDLVGTGRVEWTLTVSSDGGVVTSDPTGINCPGTCAQIFEETSSPQSVVLDAVPDPGKVLSGWSGCTPVSNGCTVLMNGNHSVTATWAQEMPRLILTVEDGGTAIPTPGGTACGPGCFDFTLGQQVTINATALRGWVFGGFSGACTGAACQLTMNGQRSVLAQFNGPHNYAFVSNTQVPISALAGAANGMCALEAADAGLPSQAWRAWVSVSSDIKDDAAFMNASGWIRTDGRPFADQLPLEGGASFVLYPPMLDARGAPAPSTVWTGTNSRGNQSDNCTNWSMTSPGAGVAGDSAGGSWRWTEDQRLACTSSASVICLGTTHSNALSLPLPPPGAQIIFVTNQEYAMSGGSVADQHCIDEAGSPGWKAVLAQNGLQGTDALPNNTSPLYRPDGVMVALQALDLRNGTAPLAPLEVTFDLHHVSGPVWTGSSAPVNQASGSNCGNWMMVGSSATVGESGVADNRWWASPGPQVNCMTGVARLYCVK